MNKKYILLILNHIKKNYPNNMPNKIKIYNDSETKEPITYEEIQNEKKTQFETDLMKRQQEFTNAMSLQVPEVPDFKDNFTDEPINEMEKMIKEMTAKRNYDVEQINNSYQKNSDQWLKSQETSIKNEKFIFNDSQKQDKSVSWGENEEFQNEDFQEEGIFKKLKKVKPFENINLAINEKTIEERLINIEEKIEKYDDKLNKVLQLLEKK